MTEPTSTPTVDTAAAVAASPALGADPGRTSSIPDVAVEPSAAVEILGNNGIKGSDAGTLLKSALLALPTVGTYEDADGRVHYANPYAKGTADRLAAREWSPVDVDQPPFDPAGKRVKDVIAHLEQHAGDEAEVQRVKAAEADGEDRPTIAAWSPTE